MKRPSEEFIKSYRRSLKAVWWTIVIIGVVLSIELPYRGWMILSTVTGGN